MVPEVLTVRLPAQREPCTIFDGRKSRRGRRVIVGPIQAEAFTAGAANNAAGAKLVEFLEGWQGPVIVSRDGYTIVCYPTPDGWARDMVTPEHGRVSRTIGGTGDEAVRSARLHVAECTVDSHDEASVTATIEWLRDRGAYVEEEETFLRSCAFQRAYRHAETLGETDPHRWACEHDREFLDHFGVPAT